MDIEDIVLALQKVITPKTKKSILSKDIKSTLVDLSDFDIYVDDYSITHKYEGYKGSWEEPAEPPYREYQIKKIIIESLDFFNQEDLMDIYNLKKGDKVKLKFTFYDDDNEVEVEDNNVIVDSVKYKSDKNEMELGLKDLYAEWYGMTPPQSYHRRGVV